MTPNCYDCIYRSDIPGNTYSRCNHPEALKNPFEANHKLEIKAVEHGVRMGWFYWPVQYDPVWLRNCNGFTAAAPAGPLL